MNERTKERYPTSNSRSVNTPSSTSSIITSQSDSNSQIHEHFTIRLEAGRGRRQAGEGGRQGGWESGAYFGLLSFFRFTCIGEGGREDDIGGLEERTTVQWYWGYWDVGMGKQNRIFLHSGFLGLVRLGVLSPTEFDIEFQPFLRVEQQQSSKHCRISFQVPQHCLHWW
ncbi:hypothetical protein VTL71DRAFT_4914 [Oculimacula yallundae]|uniref:Uncharacterized protein n=1 Tax=Oculimacula yallundae TaxID=86028 RepID=A0ABR4C434_9HELO